jgi:hypothetical protein
MTLSMDEADSRPGLIQRAAHYIQRSCKNKRFQWLAAVVRARIAAARPDPGDGRRLPPWNRVTLCYSCYYSCYSRAGTGTGPALPAVAD